MRTKQRRGHLTVVARMLCSFLLLALLPVTAFAVEYTPLATIKKGLTYPTDIAVSGSGSIYVVDGLAKKVMVYNGGYLLTGSISSLENPTAVAVSGSTLLVADNKTKSVKKLNSSGTVVGDLKNGGTTATFKLPRNIAVDGSGKVYVVDQFGNSIEVFDAAGNYTYSISGLSMPQDAVAVGNELFIIDQPLQSTTTAASTTNGQSSSSELRISRIQIFDLVTKTFVTDATRAFPAYGTDTASGQYISLKGIAVDPHNNLYVNDSYLNTLYKFDTNGQFLGTIAEPVTTPLGAAVSVDGRLVVTSSYEGTVKVLGVDYIAGTDTWGNDAPVADAGPNQIVNENAEFVLDGSGSADADGITNYEWTQTNGINVLPANPFATDSAELALTAPSVGAEGSQLRFELVVTDGNSKQSAPSSTVVTVNNSIAGSIVINNGDLYTTSLDVSLSLESPEAVEMRFANDSDPFDGTYYAYATAGQWTLNAGDGTKTVRVEFKDGGGNRSTVSSTIILDTEKPLAPAVIDAGGASGEFNWQQVDDAVTYNFQYASNSNFVGAVTFTDLDYNGLTMALDELDAGTWFWQVQSVDAAGNISDWSEPGTFTIGADCTEVPEIAQLALPFDNASDIARAAILETNAMTYAAECGSHMRTEWQISEFSDFSALVMHVGTTLDNLVVYQVPALVLEPETRYFWRVKHVASNGKESDWSEVWSFTTAADYDEQGVDGVLYVQPEDEPADTSSEEIVIRAPIGDARIKIKAVRVSSGVITKVIQEIDPDTIPDTVNKPASFPLGLLSFKLGVKPGAIAELKVIFSGPVPQDAEWYVYDSANGWHAYEGAVFSANRKSVTLTFQDGGMGDTDGVTNGIIVNP